MNYETHNEIMNECTCSPAPLSSLTEMLKQTHCIATDVLKMAYRINDHLFGIGNPLCEKEAEPKCFRDELEKTRCELMATIEELHKICSMLGV